MEFNLEQLKLIYGWSIVAEHELHQSPEEEKLAQEIKEYLEDWGEI